MYRHIVAKKQRYGAWQNATAILIRDAPTGCCGADSCYNERVIYKDDWAWPIVILKAGAPKVSVVVPVYNPGPGIVRCVESLRRQTLADIELIFVDDCGTDDAMDTVRRASAEDGRIRIVAHGENQGPGPSRNDGIDVACGEYLAFVDPDDYVEEGFFEQLFAAGLEQGLDIVKPRVVYEREDGSIAPHTELNDLIRVGVKSGNPLYMRFTYEHHGTLFRRAFLVENNVRYGRSRKDQDTTFLLRACKAARSFGFADGARYHFCERADSTMHRFSEEMLSEKLLSIQERVEYLASQGVDANGVPAYRSDRFACCYLSQTFKGFLALESFCAQLPGLRDASERQLEKARDLLIEVGLPQRQIDGSAELDGLVRYGANLCTEPFQLPWDDVDLTRWEEVVSRWIDFLLAHPTRNGVYLRCASDMFAKARLVLEQAKERGCSLAEVDRLDRFINEQRGRLPLWMRIRIAGTTAANAFKTSPAAALPRAVKRYLVARWLSVL